MKFDIDDSGSGPTLLFLPGSYSTGQAWRGVQDSLKGSYRKVSTSLPGYGGSEEIRSDDADQMSEMVDFVVGVAGQLGEPVHLVGHSYGGLAAFATALSGRVPLLSLITFEGNPIFSRREGRPYPWINDVHEMVDSFAAAIASGNPDAAGIIIDFWSRPGVFESMPDRFKDYCRTKAETNFIDWRTAAGFTPDISDYERIDIPCSIVRGSQANRMMIDISDDIAGQIPVAELHVVPDSNHFLISTHPRECASIIDEHMARHGFV